MNRRRIDRTRLLGLAALVLALVPAVSADARTPTHPPAVDRSRGWQPVPAPLVSVVVEDAQGQSLPAAQHRGKLFVAGDRGERYVIRVTNNSGERLEVVASVDGRDVVSGKLGDFRRQRGYVLEPFSTVTIDGFRRSLDEVAAFRFSDVGRSYTARRGTPQHAGVIGVAVFRERQLGWSERAPARRAKSLDAPSASARDHRGATQELGTEFGEDRRSPVVEVPFVRRDAQRPDQRVALFYDSARALVARGVPIAIDVVDPWRDRGDPEPWPSAVRDDRFAQAPEGR